MKRRLRARATVSSFVNWHRFDVYVVAFLELLRLFVPVPDWWRSNEFSQLLFVLTANMMAYCSNLVISTRALQLNGWIDIS